MSTPLQSFDVERQALTRLLASGLFARSTNLEKILVYLCERYFRGEAQLVKEYHIATEALGRSEEFDPKKDSIVRVEMHRLRKRLKEHYAAAAQDEPLQILLPEKSYLPEFRRPQLPASPLTEASEPQQALAVPLVVETGNGNNVNEGLLDRRWVMGSIVTLAAGAAGAAFLWNLRGAASASSSSSSSSSPSVAAAHAVPDEPQPSAAANRNETIRILAGHAAGRITDRYGQIWEGDRYFTGGNAVAISGEVASRGFDPNLFANMRAGDFTYEIPLQPGGVYELLLLFAETEYGERNALGGGETSRLFSVSANGRPLLSEFDVTTDAADANAATTRLFRDIAPAPDGKLHLRFGPAGTGQAFVNAIVLRPGVPGKLRPIRISCRPEIFRDRAGRIWEPDKFYRAGKQISRPQAAPGPDGELFRGERYGHFSYLIPVPPGQYGARLYFWDYWWGAGHPGRGGVGSRVFDVFCNHKPLLVNFDIVRQNPTDQTVVQTFNGLTPNGQGKLVFDFSPRVNYAQLNAIEIFEE